MKNKSLVTIAVISIFLFVGLVFAVYKIAGMNDSEFYQDGYVSITDTDLSDKVYFKSGTVYKKGYNNEIVFKNTDNVKSEVSKYSFVYYNSKAISYLNDGVLMALDELDSDYVPYYNIKSNYILAYENGHYVIKTKTKDITLDNFIGRIDENKYLVAGNNLKLKLGSSEETIPNYYFEINFVEGNQVKIDNDKINIKTVAEDSYIYVGNDVIIDLNNRIIKYKGDLKLNLSEITINSDENIDILYDSGKNNEIDDGNGGEGQGGNGNGNGGNGQENYEPEKVVEYKNVPYVELVSSNIGSNRIRLDYKVIDTFKLINGSVTVRYMNLSTSEVNEVECLNYDNLCVFDAQNLSSNTKYLVTILTSYTRSGILHRDYIMFQRTFQTSELNLGVEKEYVSSNSIAYRIKMNNDSNFDSATLNLYDNSGELVGSAKFNNNHQDVIINFDSLKSNSTYTAKIEDLVIGNVTFKTSSYGSTMNKTLKYNPLKDSLIVNSPKASSNKKDYTFSFDLGIGEDKDRAIKEVTYAIYDSETRELIKTIKKENTAPFTFEVGDEFAKDRKYVYQATLQINDNEKIIYQKSLVSNEVSLSSKVSPYSTFTRGEVTANTLAGTFKIFDADNTVDMLQGTYIEYTDSEGVKSSPKQLEYRDCGEDESATTKCVDIYLEELTSDSTYTISLYSYVDLKDDPENENYIEPAFMQVGIVQIKTSEADIVYTSWTLNEIPLAELQSKVFDIDLRFAIDTETTSQLVVDNMQSFDMILYEGAEENEVLLKTIHIGAGSSIKAEYFDNSKNITLSTFGYTLNDLITRHMTDGSKISQRYTIKLTNGKSGTDYVDFRKSSFIFDIDPTLLEITNDTATVKVNLINNNEASEEFKRSDLYPETYVALEIVPYFENRNYVTSIDYVIYDQSDNNKQYKFSRSDLDLSGDSEIPSEMLTIYDTDSEEFLKRGHSYQITYTLSLDLNGDGITDIVYPLSADITKPAPVRSSRVDIVKQMPMFSVIPWTSTIDSITYRYSIDDKDNVLGENPDAFYRIGDNNYTGTSDTCANLDRNHPYTYNCVKFNNLHDKDIYTMYFEGKLLLIEDAPLQKFDVSDFEFESIISDDEIKNKDNISFVELKNKDDNTKPRYNNLATFKIVGEDKYIKRIANYKLTIINGNETIIIDNVNDGNLYFNGSAMSLQSNNSIKYIGPKVPGGEKTASISSNPNLASVAYISYCEGTSGEKCIFFDYAKLYQSDPFNGAFQDFINDNLTIKFDITYDTGVVGYYASATKRYAFQVKSTEDVIYNDVKVNDYYYISTRNRGGSVFTFGALSGVYTYSKNSGGFVADTDISGMQDEYDTNAREGHIGFVNSVFTGHNSNAYYKLSAKGVLVHIDPGDIPMVAKELSTVTAEVTPTFKFDNVIPAIGVLVSEPTINGVRLWLSTSGYKSDDIYAENGNRYLYLEVHDTNDTKVQELKINVNELTSQTRKISHNKVTLNSISGNGYSEYKYDVARVSVNGTEITDYSYDYINGVITINDRYNIPDNTDVTVTYNIALYGLDIDSNYTFKAYMKPVSDPTDKIYLVDSTSATYDTAQIGFKTLKITDNKVKLSYVNLDVASPNYENRYLTAGINIGDDNGSEIIGFEDFIYELSYNGKLLNINSTNACDTLISEKHSPLNNSCVILSNNYYNVNTYLDITDGNVTDSDGPFRFVFGTDYNLVIKAKIKTTNGYENVIVFDDQKSVRKLENPTVDVFKQSRYDHNRNSLKFEVTFKDPDRVVKGFLGNNSINVPDGSYLGYLAKGTRREVDSVLVPYPIIQLNEQGEEVNTQTIIYNENKDGDNLLDNTDYYLILKYVIDTNNVDSTDSINQELRFPIYTQVDHGVALGKVAYFASNEGGKGISELTFSYAANIQENENQNVYVVGMNYSVSIFGGDTITGEYGKDVFFINLPDKDYVELQYVKNANASSELGENYYRVELNHEEFPTGSSGASYIIVFHLYLGGTLDEIPQTQAACESSGDYWDAQRGKCYILSSTEHEYTAQFKGSTTGGE